MMPEFDYHRPESVAEAIALKQKLGENAVYWAGGTDLMLQLKNRRRDVRHCIDVSFLGDLSGIIRDGQGLHIGALVTLAELERMGASDPHISTIAKVAGCMCTVQTRTLATIGGNLCNASPSADLFVTLVALGARARIEGPDTSREVPLDAFMTAPGRTVLGETDLLTSVLVPLSANAHASAYHRIARTVVDIALVSASASVLLDETGTCIESARIALGAVAPRVIRAKQAEAMLTGCALSDLTEAAGKEIGAVATRAASPITDLRASAQYRSDMVAVLVARCITSIKSELEACA
jgi:carbon-monoxide dehydrogenase medium subunit